MIRYKVGDKVILLQDLSIVGLRGNFYLKKGSIGEIKQLGTIFPSYLVDFRKHQGNYMEFSQVLIGPGSIMPEKICPDCELAKALFL